MTAFVTTHGCYTNKAFKAGLSALFVCSVFCAFGVASHTFAQNYPSLMLPSPQKTRTTGTIMSIQDAVLLSLRNNPDIQSAELKRVTDKYDLILAKNNYMPQFSLGGTFNANVHASANATIQPLTATINQSPLGITGNLSYDPATGTMGLKVNKKLMAGGSYTTNMNSWWTAEETAKQDRWAYRDAIIAVIHNTTKAFRTVVTDKLTLEANKMDLDSDYEQLKDAKLKLKLGRGTENDVNQSQLNIAQAKSTIITNKQQLLSDRVDLATVLGLDPSVVIHVKASALPVIHLGTLSQAIQKAFIASTDYQKAKINLTQTKRSLAIAKNAAGFSLDYAGVGTMGGDHQSSFTNTLTWGIPIDDVTHKAAILTQRVALINAQQALTTARNAVISQVTLDYNRLKNSMTALKLANMSLNLNETTVKQQEAQYQAGKISLFNLSQAKQGLTVTRNDLQSSKDALWSDIETYRTDIGTVLSSWHIMLNY